MKFWEDFVWNCRTLVVPLVAIMVIVPFIFFLVSHEAAQIFSTIATLLVMLGNLAYIAVLERRKANR